MISNLDLEPKCQGHCKTSKISIWGTKNMKPVTKLSRDSSSNGCATDMSMGYE